MTVVPVDITVSAANSSASFNCTGVSDDSTPVSVEWYKLRDKESGYSQVIEIPGQVAVEQTGSLSFQLPNNKSSWAVHAGQYKCSVSNRYSTQTKEVSLLFEDEEPRTLLRLSLILDSIKFIFNVVLYSPVLELGLQFSCWIIEPLISILIRMKTFTFMCK